MRMTIRFERERIRVMVNDGPNGIDLTAKAEDVEVDVLEHGGLWTRVLQPFETIRAGMSCAMMVHHVILARASEMKKESGEGGDGI